MEDARGPPGNGGECHSTPGPRRWGPCQPSSATAAVVMRKPQRTSARPPGSPCPEDLSKSRRVNFATNEMKWSVHRQGSKRSRHVLAAPRGPHCRRWRRAAPRRDRALLSGDGERLGVARAARRVLRREPCRLRPPGARAPVPGVRGRPAAFERLAAVHRRIAVSAARTGLGDAATDDVRAGDDRYVEPYLPADEVVSIAADGGAGDDDRDHREEPDEELAGLEELLGLRGLDVPGELLGRVRRAVLEAGPLVVRPIPGGVLGRRAGIGSRRGRSRVRGTLSFSAYPGPCPSYGGCEPGGICPPP